jgi:hypothetical protein
VLVAVAGGLVSCAAQEPQPRGAGSEIGVRPAAAAAVKTEQGGDEPGVAREGRAAAKGPVLGPPTKSPHVSTAAAAEPVEESRLERAAPGMRSFAEFRPSLHGFRFVNSFTGTPLPLEGTGLEKRLGLPDRFGLCGGMSFAAADYFLSGWTVPDISTPPERGSDLYDYLYRRQVSTLSPAGMQALKFMEWMDLAEEGSDGTHARTLAELGAIVESLQRGEPAVLGLVLVGRGSESENGRREIWQNHQVLAYASRRLPMNVVEISIYDPNYPLRDDVVVRVIGGPEVRMSRIVPGGRTTAVRGFFRMPYAQVQPPEAIRAVERVK